MPESNTDQIGSKAHKHVSQFALMRERRFAPMFIVQFSGACNDNIFKFAFTLLASYSAQAWGGVDPKIAGFLIAALFILPFLLFSATSGQLADKLEKGWMIRRIKEAEILIMTVAAYGFFAQQAGWLYACVFLMGLHSTLFGPLKFAYLPQHLSDGELVGGNGMFEMGSFVAILSGTIAGGLLIGIGESGADFAALAVLVLAVLGRLAASWIPCSPAPDPGLRINWNPLAETIANLKIAARRKAVFNSLLGISWLWFFGAVFLTSFTPFAHIELGGNESVVTFLLAIFSLFVGMGSLMCERLSAGRIEIGLVPLGSIGMTLFAIDLYFAATGFHALNQAGVTDFISAPGAWRIVLDLALLAFSGGLYSVPLYALIQSRTERTHTARIIAANNILNAIFMIASSLMAMVLLKSGLSIAELFLVVGLLNAAVAIYIYRLVPEFLMRFLAWMLVRSVYRIRTSGMEHVPREGPAVLVCNHVSFVDAVVLMGECPRPVRFVMDHRIFRVPVLHWLFRQVGAIAVASGKEDSRILEGAYQRIDAALREGELVGIFPEGRITRNGELNVFRPGVQRIVERNPVPVIPMALRGLWGSFFSRFGGAAFAEPVDALLRRGWRSDLQIAVGSPMAPADATPERLRAVVADLRGHHR
jgi:1-acyl-sn-glycerol-3-phosphate acyltransferase